MAKSRLGRLGYRLRRPTLLMSGVTRAQLRENSGSVRVMMLVYPKMFERFPPQTRLLFRIERKRLIVSRHRDLRAVISFQRRAVAR